MVSKLELENAGQLWNINLSTVGNLEFNANNTVGGDLRMLIDDDTGNVGIGTNSPQNKLQLGIGDIAIGDNPHRAGKIRLWQEADNADNRVSHSIGTEHFHNTYGAGSAYTNSIGHKFYRGGGELIAQIGFGGGGLPGGRLNSYLAGNVGVGVPIPTAKLQVRGQLGLESTSGFELWNINVSSAGNLEFNANNVTGGDTRMLINDNSGNVGIGTNNPLGKLDVNGTIYQRGSVLHADYVFESDYQLESIEEHAEFMWKEKRMVSFPRPQKDENGQEIIEYGSYLRGIVEELEKAHLYIAKLNDLVIKQQKAISELSGNT